MLFYLLILSFNFGAYQVNLLGSWIVYLLYFLATYSIVLVVKDVGWKVFKDVFEVYVAGVVVLILLSFFIWKISGVYFLADDGYGYHRPHALLSEPSACALFLSYALLVSYYRKRYVCVLLAFVAIAISGSILAVIISLAVYIYGYLKERSVLYVIFFLFVIMSLLYFGYYFVLDYSPSGGGLDSQILRIRQAIISIESFGEDGYNPRLNTTIDMLMYMDLFFSSWFVGFGPGADTYLPFSEVASSGSSLITVLLFNFGLIGMFGYLLLILHLLRKVASGTDFWFFTVASFLTTSLNSAEGLLIYQLMLFSVLLGFGHEKIKISSS
ncbi:hypothetical protein [Thalassolituus oleivorans]|uniref:hypothetical protein n=1 Tax=Thalassolituus oleivorans TaxID=187493 RepID=UPI0011AB73BC|nr:hypothetical protein [Thalassolituus oleivorans]